MKLSEADVFQFDEDFCRFKREHGLEEIAPTKDFLQKKRSRIQLSSSDWKKCASPSFSRKVRDKQKTKLLSMGREGPWRASKESAHSSE